MRQFALVSTLLTTLAMGSHAAADAGQFYLAPGLQWMDFSSATGLDNDMGYFIGLGYDLTDRIGFELSTFDLDPDTNTGTGGDFDIDHYKLDVLYYFNDNRVQPFVVGGMGNTNFNGENDTVFDLGAGLKVDLADNLVWRTTLRSFNHLNRDFEDTDYGIDSSLIFYFGGNERPQRQTASTPTPTSTPTPAAPRDSDRDGVPDSSDECPDTPMNYAVDEDGCPIPVEEMARVELLVNFDFDRAVVKPEYFDEIEEVADFMEQYPDVIVELEGHTDSIGTNEYNMGLGQRRANAVRDLLIEEFDVQSSRISAVSYGEEQPVASNDTAAGRADNRRTITMIIKTLQRYRAR
ncbi:MAG: OmpA family protein [Pseudohongiellaceae bacterium]